ncbi:penicillin amidase [Methylosinus sp. sav-2]|uniref:penicillin acylase family protein n=1 Tax=Methylosinus sp. sav-2 TaxID=2485168 RepID=UPI00047999F5|nr:penicillin acylase family protein [Methylosinus sp. sav-2]TDX61136.1 penicillin amidase [Methylosinus sp. sav-2]
MRKAMRRSGVLIVAALLAGAATLVGVVRLPLPWEGGSHVVPGLGEAVVVEFDSVGVPHIRATSRTDAYAALGYATARDRLFQMDMLRRKTGGRLAEIFGSALVKDDSWSRAMGFERLAGAILRQLPAEQGAALTAYAAGVNQAMRDALAWPWEFTVLAYAPEPWRLQDSILVALNLADLSYSADQERAASVMRAALPEAVVDFLTPDGDCYNEMLAPRTPERCTPGALPAREIEQLMREAGGRERSAGLVQNERAPRGSNGWVVARGKTRDGRAILANDMHLSLETPNIWYQADLAYGSRRVEGLTLPGLPMVITGTNGRVAWGLTSVEGDFADLARLRRDAAEPSKYLTSDGAREFSARVERIGVRGAPEIVLQVKETIWGPVLPEPLLGEEVALRWTMLDPIATNLDLMDMDSVATAAEAAPVMRGAGVPPLNALLADSSGSVMWTLMGKIPKRRGLSGLFAEFWDDGSVGWDGYYSQQELPSIVDPASGYIVSANQRMLGAADFAPKIGHDYSGGFRAWRIDQRLNESSRIDESDMAALQLDASTEFYRYYQTLARRALNAPESEGDKDAAALIHALETWDGRAEDNSLGLPLIVEFRNSLIDAVLSPLLARCRALEPGFVYEWSNADVPVQRIIDSGRAELLPDRDTHHDWPHFLRAVLRESARRLAQSNGRRPVDDLRWGEANRVEIRHPLAAATPLLAPVLNMPRVPVAGCRQCVRFYFADAGKSSGANARMVVAPGRESEGLMQMAAGQSGQFGSPHYADREMDWVAGRSRPFRATNFDGRMILNPAR